jgi:ABC-type dipeptide/oligopeptide/nickel transport system permease subunit
MTTQDTLRPQVVRLDTGEEVLLRSESLFTKAMRRLRRDRLTMVALGIIGVLALISLLAPLITKYILEVDIYATDGRLRYLPIGTEGHLLGTDNLGRDFLGRLLWGGRVSLFIGIASATVILTVGTMLGMITGYFGGVVDDFMIWIITTLDSLPQLYLLIAISALLNPGPLSLILIISVTGWTGTTRLVRGQTIAIRDLDYVIAARALGASPWRILRLHVLPNLISILTVSMALAVGGIILAEAALSFLNLGVQEPTPTWGNMLTKATQYFRVSGHLVALPGLLISIVVLCLYIIGDGVRDAFDPQLND